MTKTLLLVLTAALAVETLLPMAQADEIDKKTRITVNEPILIPGRTLPPGKYVLKLDRSASNRNIVRIFNDDENQVFATIIAINNYRTQPTDDTVLQFWETPAGSPPALRAWFAPGDYDGQEFAYPKEMAERLARENNAKVASYDANETSAADLSSVSLQTAEPPAGVPNLQEKPSPDTSRFSAAVTAQAAPLPPVPAVDTTPLQLAQNEPVPSPVAAQDNATDSATSLPSTASSTGWIVLIGLSCLFGALLLRARAA